METIGQREDEDGKVNGQHMWGTERGKMDWWGLVVDMDMDMDKDKKRHRHCLMS